MEPPLECDPKRHATRICEWSTLDSNEMDKRDMWHTPAGPGILAAIIALGSVGYLNPSVLSWLHPGAFLSSESLVSLAPVLASFSPPPILL